MKAPSIPVSRPPRPCEEAHRHPQSALACQAVSLPALRTRETEPVCDAGASVFQETTVGVSSPGNTPQGKGFVGHRQPLLRRHRQMLAQQESVNRRVLAYQTTLATNKFAYRSPLRESNTKFMILRAASASPGRSSPCVHRNTQTSNHPIARPRTSNSRLQARARSRRVDKNAPMFPQPGKFRIVVGVL